MLKRVLTILLATTLLCSCTNSLITLPDVQCIALQMPPPIPQNMRLVIDHGLVDADQGGADFLRSYAAIRKDIKRAWYE